MRKFFEIGFQDKEIKQQAIVAGTLYFLRGTGRTQG